MSDTRKCCVIRLIAALSVLLSGTLLSQPDRTADLKKMIEERVTWDYPSFVLDKLRSHRIVMLADAGHGIGLYQQTVIEVLNSWATACEAAHQGDTSSMLPRTLFLVLEMDSLRADALKRYFKSGDIAEALEPESLMGYQTTAASIEFLSDLRDFWLRVDTLNRTLLKDHPVSFDLIGPENKINTLDWSNERKDRYFFSERDEYSSSQIIHLLDSRPEAKALLFYGSAHYLVGEQQKRGEKSVGKGYYLAHYLTEHFRERGGIYTFEQVSIPLADQLDDVFRKIGKSFAADNSSWTNIPVGANSFLPHFDGTIFFNTRTIQVPHISRIFTENLVNAILKKIDAYCNTSNEYSRYYLKLWFVYLSNFTDKNYTQINPGDSLAVAAALSELKSWRASTKLDVVHDIETLAIWKRSIERIRSSSDPQSMQYERLLAGSIGFKVWFQNGASPAVRADAVWEYIKRYKKAIIIDNLAALLWIGTAAEKEKALSILERETGQKFRRAKEWTRWLEQSKL